MAVVPHEGLAIPPLEAFLITPRFAVSDLWVWPLIGVVMFFMMRGYHRAAGLKGRDVDLIIALKALNGLFLWGTLIAVSRAVHRATDDLLVSGLWTGVILTVTTGGMQLVLKRSSLAPAFERVQETITTYRQRLKEEGRVRKEANERGETVYGENGRKLHSYVAPDSALDAKRHVSALMHRNLFADPPSEEPPPTDPLTPGPPNSMAPSDR